MRFLQWMNEQLDGHNKFTCEVPSIGIVMPIRKAWKTAAEVDIWWDFWLDADCDEEVKKMVSTAFKMQGCVAVAGWSALSATQFALAEICCICKGSMQVAGLRLPEGSSYSDILDILMMMDGDEDGGNDDDDDDGDEDGGHDDDDDDDDDDDEKKN